MLTCRSEGLQGAEPAGSLRAGPAYAGVVWWRRRWNGATRVTGRKTSPPWRRDGVAGIAASGQEMTQPPRMMAAAGERGVTPDAGAWRRKRSPAWENACRRSGSVGAAVSRPARAIPARRPTTLGVAS
jgi:hypothetical protein